MGCHLVSSEGTCDGVVERGVTEGTYDSVVERGVTLNGFSPPGPNGTLSSSPSGSLASSASISLRFSTARLMIRSVNSATAVVNPFIYSGSEIR